MDQLQALSTTVVHANKLKDDVNDVICVLILDYLTRRVQVKTYMKEDFDSANSLFSRAELESSNNPSKSVLMASLQEIKELPNAYPSYFLDTKAFFEELSEFENSSKFINDKQ